MLAASSTLNLHPEFPMKRLTPTALLCIGALLLGFPTAQGKGFGERRTVLDDRKIGTFENAPPMPAPVNLALIGRSKVRVFLRVRGLQKEPATFILRGEPEHGTAKLLPQISREWAEVEYTPPQGREITSDSFKFVVSNSRGTSSESIAVISIKDIGPRLETPHHLNFGILQTGQSREMPLEIRNSGDTVAAGSLSVSGEWAFADGFQNYELEPGQTATFPLRLAPKSTGSQEGEIRFSSDPTRSVFLLAKVEDWIEATPDPILLRTTQSPMRSATLILTNQTNFREWIQIESEPALAHPYGVWIESKQTILVPITTASPTPVEQVGKITLRGSQGRHRFLLWRTSALGPALGGLSGIQRIWVNAQGKSLTVWNEGGRAGKWMVQTSDPFKLSLPNESPTNAAEFTLAPGETLTLSVTAPTKPLPKQDGTLQIRTLRHPLLGGGTTQSIVLTVRKPSLPNPIKDSAAASPPAPQRGNPAVSLRDLAAPISTPSSLQEAPYFPPSILDPKRKKDSTETPSLDPNILKNIRNAFMPGMLANNIFVSHLTSHSVRLTIPPPKNIPLEQISVLTRSSEITAANQLRTVWTPLKGLTTKMSRLGQVVLDLEGLPTDSTVGILISGPLMEGGRRVVLNQFDLKTPAQPFWLSPQRPWFWIAGAFFGFVALQRFRNRRFRR